MSPLKLGTTDVADVKVGGTQASAVYLGGTKVWPGDTPPPSDLPQYQHTYNGDSPPAQGDYSVTSGLTARCDSDVLNGVDGNGDDRTAYWTPLLGSGTVSVTFSDGTTDLPLNINVLDPVGDGSLVRFRALVSNNPGYSNGSDIRTALNALGSPITIALTADYP